MAYTLKSTVPHRSYPMECSDTMLIQPLHAQPAPSLPSRPARFLGCDVARLEIVIYDSLSGITHKIPNKHRALTQFLRSIPDITLLLCENTGGYAAYP